MADRKVPTSRHRDCSASIMAARQSGLVKASHSRLCSIGRQRVEIDDQLAVLVVVGQQVEAVVEDGGRVRRHLVHDPAYGGGERGALLGCGPVAMPARVDRCAHS